MIPSDALVLLDTNILVHLIRADKFGQSIDIHYTLHARQFQPLISVVTVGEILAFATKQRWEHRKLSRLEGLLRAVTIVNINQRDILNSYASIATYAEATGRSIGQNDLWIAATAAGTNAFLLTTDSDFVPLHPNFIQLEWIDLKIF